MSSLDQNQGGFSHWNLGKLRNGQRERREREREKEAEQDERKKERVMPEHLSLIIWKEKVSSSEKLTGQKIQLHCRHTLTHIHTNRWGCAFLQVPCIKPQWKTTERKECVRLYVCKVERGVVEDYKGSEKQKEWWENGEKTDKDS